MASAVIRYSHRGFSKIAVQKYLNDRGLSVTFYADDTYPLDHSLDRRGCKEGVYRIEGDEAAVQDVVREVYEFRPACLVSTSF